MDDDLSAQNMDSRSGRFLDPSQNSQQVVEEQFHYNPFEFREVMKWALIISERQWNMRIYLMNEKEKEEEEEDEEVGGRKRKVKRPVNVGVRPADVY